MSLSVHVSGARYALSGKKPSVQVVATVPVPGRTACQYQHMLLTAPTVRKSVGLEENYKVVFPQQTD